jgi:hypothetical protein
MAKDTGKGSRKGTVKNQKTRSYVKTAEVIVRADV